MGSRKKKLVTKQTSDRIWNGMYPKGARRDRYDRTCCNFVARLLAVTPHTWKIDLHARHRQNQHKTRLSFLQLQPNSISFIENENSG